jgi:hypothetical protein
MRLRNLPVLVLAATAAVATGCASHLWLGVRGTITLRRSVSSTAIIAVTDSAARATEPCGHTTIVSVGPDTRIVHEDGTSADTSILAVGRTVSVFLLENGGILQSCPAQAYAAKIVVH